MASMSSCFTVKPSRHTIFIPGPSIFPKRRTCFSRIQAPQFRQISVKFPDHVVSVPIVRASSGADVTEALNRGCCALESDQLPFDVRKRVIEAVDACGGRVTLGDVASMTGLKLSDAQKALQALAADTNGLLEVSIEGDVLYVFPKDFFSKLADKSFRIKIESLAEKAKTATKKLVMVSFGTALIASIVLVYATIILILIIKSDNNCSPGGSDNNCRSPGGGSYGIDFHINVGEAKQENDEEMNFIESVSSFVFGDGDPNNGIEEKRWKLIGSYITFNDGVVTAEELAPYLDFETTNGKMVDESYILPVLLRFEGQPEIDKEGNILYLFPTLQRTASQGRRWAESVVPVEKFLIEKKWQFSKTNIPRRAMVFGLGVLNLFGVIILGNMLKEIPVTYNGLIEFACAIFPLFQIFAAFLVLIPLARLFFYWKWNADIEKRNQAREQRASSLEQPNASLRQKLQNARDLAERTFIEDDGIVYSTERDLFEQDYEAQNWDSRFLETGKSD